MHFGSLLRASRQRGIGLLEVALVTVVVGGAFVAGVAALRSHQQSSATTAAMTGLTQADRYIAGFVAANNRLPCPDSSHEGYETCDGNVQKGWLPYRTLGLEGSMAAAGVGLIAYEVQRTVGTGVDLAAVASTNNSFEPVAFDNTDYVGRRALNNAGTTADFCQNLRTAKAATVIASQPRVGTIGSGGYPVAYALAYPGRNITNSSGNIFDGLNAGGMGGVAVAGINAMELPQRGSLLGSYEDRVVARTYDGLGIALGCDRLLASINSISLAGDVVEEVKSLQTTNKSIATWATVSAGITIGVLSAKLAGGLVSLGTAIALVVGASAELAADVASCFILVGCFLIPFAIFSLVTSVVSIAATSVAIGLNAGAMVYAVQALQLTQAAATEAGNALGTPAAMDFSANVLAAKNKRDEANAGLTAPQSALTTANTTAASAQVTSDANYAALKTQAHQFVAANNARNMDTPLTTPLGTYDANFDAVVAKADASWAADRNVGAAQSALEQSQKAGDTSAQTSQISAQISNIGTQIDAANNQISSLNTQIAATTDSAAVALLRTQLTAATRQRDDLLSQSASLTSQLGSFSLDLASAQTNVTSATTAAFTAKTALATAKTNAIAPFLMTYSFCYDVQSSTNSSQSTRTCEPRTQDNRAAITTALDAQFNITDGAYLKYLNGNSAKVAAQTVYNNALQTQTQAQATNNSLNALVSGTANPATGTLPVAAVSNSALDILTQVDRIGGIR